MKHLLLASILALSVPACKSTVTTETHTDGKGIVHVTKTESKAADVPLVSTVTTFLGSMVSIFYDPTAGP